MHGRTVGKKLENPGISKVVYYSPSIRAIAGNNFRASGTPWGPCGSGNLGSPRVTSSGLYQERSNNSYCMETDCAFIHLSSSPLSPLSSASPTPPPPPPIEFPHHNPHALPAHREQGSVSNLTTPWKIFWLMRSSYARMATLIEWKRTVTTPSPSRSPKDST